MVTSYLTLMHTQLTHFCWLQYSTIHHSNSSPSAQSVDVTQMKQNYSEKKPKTPHTYIIFTCNSEPHKPSLERILSAKCK